MIVFCSTCKGRAQHIKQTLPQNLIDTADEPDVKFVIVNYGSPDDLVDYLQQQHSNELASGRVVLYSYPEGGPFKMAHAKNMAHRLGILEGGDILVNLDADNYVGIDFVPAVRAAFAQHGYEAYMSIGEIRKGITPRGVCGRIVVSAFAFLATGGYDETFETWSPDDKDFNQRLSLAGYTRVIMPESQLTCVRHNDKMRFKDYPQAKTTTHCEHAVLASRGEIGRAHV